MNLKKIVKGRWYLTKHGAGVCERVGGTFPPSVQIRVTRPLPLGLRVMTPREVERELTEEEAKQIC